MNKVTERHFLSTSFRNFIMSCRTSNYPKCSKSLISVSNFLLEPLEIANSAFFFFFHFFNWREYQISFSIIQNIKQLFKTKFVHIFYACVLSGQKWNLDFKLKNHRNNCNWYNTISLRFERWINRFLFFFFLLYNFLREVQPLHLFNS